MEKDEFICSKCGIVTPSTIYDSCPAQADCPNCGEHMEGKTGIRMMSEEEARKVRPGFYEKYDLAKKIAQKIKDEYSVVIFSSFMDECDVDTVEDKDLIATIMLVLNTKENRKAKLVLHHDDPPCEERLIDGYCEICKLHPDMQSTCLWYYCPVCDIHLKEFSPVGTAECISCKGIFTKD